MADGVSNDVIVSEKPVIEVGEAKVRMDFQADSADAAELGPKQRSDFLERPLCVDSLPRDARRRATRDEIGKLGKPNELRGCREHQRDVPEFDEPRACTQGF